MQFSDKRPVNRHQTQTGIPIKVVDFKKNHFIPSIANYSGKKQDCMSSRYICTDFAKSLQQIKH